MTDLPDSYSKIVTVSYLSLCSQKPWIQSFFFKFMITTLFWYSSINVLRKKIIISQIKWLENIVLLFATGFSVPSVRFYEQKYLDWDINLLYKWQLFVFLFIHPEIVFCKIYLKTINSSCKRTYVFLCYYIQFLKTWNYKTSSLPWFHIIKF